MHPIQLKKAQQKHPVIFDRISTITKIAHVQTMKQEPDLVQTTLSRRHEDHMHALQLVYIERQKTLKHGTNNHRTHQQCHETNHNAILFRPVRFLRLGPKHHDKNILWEALLINM
jgi:hypothetical protein